MSRFKTMPVENNVSDWKIMRRRGSKVRYQNMVTGAWDRWETDTIDYVRPFLKSLTVTDATPTDAESLAKAYNVAALRDLAKARGIKVTSKMRKSEIITALTN